ncbi:Gfo/Idh/MocA family protein [Polaribacter sp. MED152]|uniref:Gfo/Idh/MocA family protein n=1 Tax=Polaribacter sp. MED152 TaxID=313598 RepID=UPI000068C954|nr:Gfo/Idh/MocA family oxidoreductase [Polaribacter sp. MED152]EAQ42181.1 oxidoreductase, Gfo/Idh/MocA family [Polaribacter sp. MED152]
MNILILGLGSIALKHIDAIKNLNIDYNLFALRSKPNSNKIEDVVNIYDLQNIMVDIDFAIISNPTSEHAKSIKSLINLEVPLFIEKPVFDTIDHEGIIDEINTKKIRTYIGCNLRFLECLNFIKGLIENKRINEVNVYCGSYLPEWRPNIDFRKNYSANKELGGGVHIDLIHEIDYIYWLFSQPTTVSRFFSNKSSLNISAYDYANYLLRYDNFTVNVQLNYYRRDPKRTLEIVCEEGTYFIDLLKNCVFLNGNVIFESKNKIGETLVHQMNFFINEVVHNKKNDFNNINEAFKILKICLED